MGTCLRKSLVASLALLVWPGFAEAQPADAEVRLPFPKFAPRPSAVTLYCRPSLSSSIGGHEDVDKDPAHIGARIDTPRKIGDDDGTIKVAFSGKKVLVQQRALMLATPSERREGFGQAFAYQVLNDDPGNFVAVRDMTKEVGHLDVLSVDRETGTLMLTSTYASLPDRGHPHTSATFYVCEPLR